MKWTLTLTLLIACSAVACSRPLVTGRDVEMKSVTMSFNAPLIATFEAAEQALRNMDYKVEYADKDQGVLRTGWMPTKVDSHYLELFGRRDYGITGAYYHVAVRITADGPSVSKLEVSAPIRTIISRMHSSHVIEKKFLAKVKDLLRPADIQVTNIGVVEKEPVPVRP